jgi:hypothetical protein
MQKVFAKLYGRSEERELQSYLKQLCDAVEAFRREDQNPVPCHIMKKVTKDKLFAIAESIRPQVYGEELTRKV